MASMGEQSLRNRPAMWLGVRKAVSPRIWAARVRLAPLGRTAISTGRSRMWAVCQALARSVVPPRPS